jgi:hypothetical protein
MKNKTAVELLVDKLIELGYLYSVNYGQSTRVKKVIKQAKAMEKEQHQQTATHFFPTSLKKEDFEQYYKETFGQ